MKKRLIFLFLIIFLLGFLLGWALEYGALLNGEFGSPVMENIKTRLWPFEFWDYLY